MQDLEENTGVTDGALSGRVVVTRKQVFSDSFENEESLLVSKPFLEEKPHHHVHTLAVVDKGIIGSESSQHLSEPPSHLQFHFAPFLLS